MYKKLFYGLIVAIVIIIIALFSFVKLGNSTATASQQTSAWIEVTTPSVWQLDPSTKEPLNDLKTGDEVLFIRRPELVPFAKAKLTKVYEKKFKELSEADKDGHEKFETNHGMYKTYTGYYGKPVHGETPVKIIKFVILEWL